MEGPGLTVEMEYRSCACPTQSQSRTELARQATQGIMGARVHDMLHAGPLLVKEPGTSGQIRESAATAPSEHHVPCKWAVGGGRFDVEGPEVLGAELRFRIVDLNPTAELSLPLREGIDS